MGVQLCIKRGFDLAVSVALLVLLSPLLVAFAVLIKLETPGEVFFRQERLGGGGGARVFRIFKFRTMVQDAINIGTGIKTSADDPRITRVGRFLRRHSLDELPQLLNIIAGDMSIVGPRPFVPQYFERFPEEFTIRARMRPGVTGLAQVRGRSSILLAERVKHDVEYVRNWSLWMDLKILLRTVPVMLRKDQLYYRKTFSDQPK